jgi:hypothetical protein
MKRAIFEREADRFWPKVAIQAKGCWEWVGHISKKGYGEFWYGNRLDYAHRFSFLLHGGKLTKANPHVLHTCDNRKCVRPGHLYAGTPQNNTDDMILRGRAAVGEKNGLALLTQEDVAIIRRLYGRHDRYKRGSVSQQYLADKFSVSLSTIHAVLTRRSWHHV